MTTGDMEIVSALRAALAEKVGRERFALWFGPETRLEFDGHTLTVGVPNRFFLDWIRTNFRRQIQSACLAATGKNAAVEFRIHGSQPDSPAKKAQSGKHTQATQPSQRPLRPASSDTVPASPRGGSANGYSRRKFASLKSFVVGPTNLLASASAETTVRRPGRYTPLLIHGPTGVGKTHLLEGIWSAVRRSDRNLAAVYLSAEQFTSYFLEALRGTGLPSFRRKYRGVGLLIVDDLQFLAGKRATQVELLHTVDALLREGRQLVFAADRPPAELAELGPELTTRLEGGMVCRIERPDYATRLGIVAQMARRLGAHVPHDVLAYVASRLTNHARELSGALCRLQATSVALDRPITLAVAEEALAEMIRNSARIVRLADIERAVCDVFGLDSGSLLGEDKSKRVTHPRMLAMWLARKHTRAALSEIGRFFGRRSHSTVISAGRRVDGWMASGHPVRLADANWDVDDAIRQVERHLRAG